MPLLAVGIVCLVALTLLISCGRRGDPVLLTPEESVEVRQDAKDAGTGQVDAEEKEMPEEAQTLLCQPAPPDGVTALFTGSGIVLAWNDIIDGNISVYRVYRSSGHEFIIAGETVSPAYTDRDITPGTTYSYYVTAVGKTEGLPSDRIIVKTERR